jgi:hypothetical protein
MTRNQAGQIQQYVNAFLTDSNIDINENYILSKSCVLLLLRFAPTKIIQVDEEKSKEQDFINNMHCLRTSSYDPCI